MPTNGIAREGTLARYATWGRRASAVNKVIDSRSPRYALSDVAALARDASMSTSYKPALLKALVRITREAPGAQIPLRRIGAEFLRLYWVQTVVFRLRQAATLQREPEMVRAIRSAAELHRVRRLDALPTTVRNDLERDLARVLTINVLEAFHRSKPLGMAPLFEWARGGSEISVSADSVAFMTKNDFVLTCIANLWWARYLEKVNLLAPLVIEKVERDGAERSSLARFLKLLRQVDEPVCFYCARDLKAVASIHVDHVIPWSFLLADPLWDLVLTCASCNISKSDRLPSPEYLDKLTLIGARRARLTLPVGFGSPMLQRDEIDRYYSAALGVEWPHGWSP